MLRRDFLQTSGATAAAISLPTIPTLVTLNDPSTLTPLVTAPDVEIQSFGSDGTPSFIVPYDDADERDALTEWVDGTDGGRVIRDHDTVGMLSITIPWSAAGRQAVAGIGHWGGDDTLETRSEIQYADANAILSRPEPIAPSDLLDVSDADYLGAFSWPDQLQLRIQSLWGSTSTTGGLAFSDDAPETPLGDARALANDTTADGSGATVAIIDSGANDRAAFNDDAGDSRILDASTDFTSSGDPTVGEEGPNAVADPDGHGDWVSMAIASNATDTDFQGFAPAADILVAKSLADGSGSTEHIIAGIELAIDEGADVACMSLGSPMWSQALADALTEAYENGVLPVVAVGNDRFGSVFVASPASAERGFGVSATNVPKSGDRGETQIAYFANVGPQPGTTDFSEGKSQDGGHPLLAAPGMNVRIDPVGTLSGTSMAAPMVAGAATLLRAAGHSVDETWTRLTESAYPIPNAGETETNHGLLDVEAALADEQPAETQADVRDTEATARDGFHRRASDAYGGVLADLFR